MMKVVHIIVSASIVLLLRLQGTSSFAAQRTRSPAFGSTVGMSSNAAVSPATTEIVSKENDLKPTLADRFSHNFEKWALQNPKKVGPIRRLLFKALSFYELALFGGSGKEQWRKRLVFGRNFVFGGAVFCGEYDMIEKYLTTEPQARGNNLAGVPLDKERIPHRDGDKDRLLSLIVLSQKGAGGNGDWEGLRAATDEYCTNSPEAFARQNDATSKKLLASLANDYKKLGQKETFFYDNNQGLKDFLLKYLHYVIFGIDPFDEEKVSILRKFHYTSQSPAYFIKPVWRLLQLAKFRDWPKQYDAVADIYLNSPAIQNFPENEEKYTNLTKEEFARGMVSAIAIAAMVGPADYATFTLGFVPLHEHIGHDTHKFDVTKVWDKLNLDDPMEVMRYIMECGRLRQPVRKSPRLVTPDEDFTVKIQGKDETFPAGTIVFIPMQFAMVDEDKWGPTAFEFNHNRPGLAENFMAFHSVGDKTAGRICPGRNIALRMISDVVVELGKVRRSPDFNPQVA